MDRKLTDEVLKNMAGLLPMDNDYVHEFTPELYNQFPEEVRPYFQIKQFNNEQVLRIKKIMYSFVTKKDKSGKQATPSMSDIEKMNKSYMNILHEVFVGWGNLYNVRTKELVSYDGELETLMSLPESVRTVILEEATRITGFTLGN